MSPPRDTTGPTVTINQSGSQSDPTNLNPIEFTVVLLGPTSRASVLNVVEMIEFVPATSLGVIVTRDPAFRAMGVRYFSLPVRIFGPWRS